MRDEMQARLELLRTEFETGERRLEELERQRVQLTETMLRISGAMQVLEEMLGEAPADEASADGTAVAAAGERT
jgi:predicted nuclease with TOPRIM domain